MKDSLSHCGMFAKSIQALLSGQAGCWIWSRGRELPFPVVQNCTFASAYRGCQSTSGVGGWVIWRKRTVGNKLAWATWLHHLAQPCLRLAAAQEQGRGTCPVWHSPSETLAANLGWLCLLGKWDFGMTFLKAIPRLSRASDELWCPGGQKQVGGG